MRWIWLLAFVCACGAGPDFSGTYAGDYHGYPTTLVLRDDDGTLTGRARFIGTLYDVFGEAEGEAASGRVRNPRAPAGFRFEASLDGDALAWANIRADGQRIEMALRRTSKTVVEGEREANLIGTWRRGRALAILKMDGGYRFERGGLGGGSLSGSWKTDDGVLYVMPRGREAWERLGTFAVSGNLFEFQPASGEMQEWKRR